MIADQRTQSVLTAMQQAGLEAILALNGDVHAFQRLNPVMLLSGVRSIGDSCVILRHDGDSTLIVSPVWETERAMACSRTTRTDATDDVLPALVAAVQRLGVLSSRIGIVGLDTMSYAAASQLMRAIGSDSRRFDAEFSRATRRKSAQEIASARRATAIAEQGYDLMLRIAAPGVREIDVATEICTAMAAQGADDNFLMLSGSRHNRAVRPPSSHVLEDGDIILCEISPSFDGQFSQICRTAYVGTPPAHFASKYALLQESFRRGMAAAVPGVTVGDIVAALNENLIEAGYGEFCVPPHMRARGHGLGSGSIEPGDLSANSKTTIDRDMIFVIHPNQYITETGYMMCGDPVVITDAGAQNLAAHPASLDQIPARA